MKRTALRARSPERARQIREYIPQAEAFLQANPHCTYPDCTASSTVIHHSRGRRGKRLLDQTWWRASCHPHNQAAEDDTGHALTIGWLHRIEGI